MGFGFSEGAAMWWLSTSDLSRELDGVKKTGAKWLRILVDWSKIETSRGSYNWSQLDAMISAASSRGLTVLANIMNTPTWARPSGSFLTAPPTDDTYLANFLRAFVGRYFWKVSYYEIWNEPNLLLFFGGANDPTRYTSMLKTAYTTIKCAQWWGTVIVAGMARSVSGLSPLTYYQKMYAAGARSYFDATAMHPYVYPSGISANPENAVSDTLAIRNLMVAKGDSNKKMWLTEIGAPTLPSVATGVTQTEQANEITSVLATAADYSWVGPTFIYSIRDYGTSPTDLEQHFGALYDYDWNIKSTGRALGL